MRTKKKIRIEKNTTAIKVECKGCGITYDIVTSTPKRWTPEVIKNWKCILCKGERRTKNERKEIFNERVS